jgi:hypothetical protein
VLHRKFEMGSACTFVDRMSSSSSLAERTLAMIYSGSAVEFAASHSPPPFLTLSPGKQRSLLTLNDLLLKLVNSLPRRISISILGAFGEVAVTNMLGG